LLDSDTQHLTTTVVTTEVYMRDYTDAEIAAYVANGDPYTKAGGYAIQHREFHPVARVNGCYTNVVGLPICTVTSLLAAYGIRPSRSLTCMPDHLPCQYQGL